MPVHGEAGGMALRVQNLWFEYTVRREKIEAVRGVSIELRRGRTYGLVGESGCGKSTVAYAIMGYTGRNGKITEGSVELKGKDLVRMGHQELRKLWGREIAMVFQDPAAALNPAMRVGDQVADVLRHHKGYSRKLARTEAIGLLEAVHMIDPVLTSRRYPHELSGGMKQRVCIAMSVALGPAVLIMDEPTTALDVTTEAGVLDIVQELKERLNVAILYITHDLGIVARVCDDVGVMYMGQLVEEASVGDMFRNQQHPYTRALLGCIPRIGDVKTSKKLISIPGSVESPKDRPKGCPFRPRCGFATERCREREPEVVKGPSGHWWRCGVPLPTAQATGEGSKRDGDQVSVARCAEGEEILRVEGLDQHYMQAGGTFLAELRGQKTRVKAVDQVSFNLGKGCTLAVVGESGSGKTTLARCILGFLRPAAGRMELRGESLMDPLGKRSRRTQSRLSMVFQSPEATLNPKHTVGYAIARPLRLRGGVAPQEIGREVGRCLEAVNLPAAYATRYPRELSGGQKQRVAIARALATRPDVVVCDEPTSALDVSVQASILMLLLDLQSRMGVSYLFISHDLSVVRYLSDRIAVMYLGAFCEVGRADEVFRPPYHPYTEALLSAIPIADPAINQKAVRLHGLMPSLVNLPKGCRFHTRCPRKVGEICETIEPPEVVVTDEHRIHCHIPLDKLSAVEPVVRV